MMSASCGTTSWRRTCLCTNTSLSAKPSPRCSLLGRMQTRTTGSRSMSLKNFRTLREVVDLFDFDCPERSFRLRRGMDDYETEALLFTALQNLTQNPVFLGAPRETTCTKG